MTRQKAIQAVEPVESLIRSIRGQRVILDADLARVYGITTARLNQQVRRNGDRFPEDFVFQLTADEFAGLMLQFATSKKGHGGRRKLPLAFTEHGAIMAANVLNSSRAVQMSVFVVRAFVKMREALGQNRQLAEKLAELERQLTDRLDVHEKAIVHILDEIKKLMEPMPPSPEPKRREIGFHVRDEVGSKIRSSRGSEAQIKTCSNPVRASVRRLLQA
ncbi:MAG TPA: ORF6N domain-containing protein [Candidatus Limnocylindrales bacterium]|nr:ORF6N domain-containing protein [Candidatus Limnocylindrales bacterium]